MYHPFSPEATDIYFRWYMKWSPNFRFQADHKIIITGDETVPQDIYINTRPNAGSNTVGQFTIHAITQQNRVPYGGFWHSNNVQITRGVWHLIEAHLRMSSPAGATNALFEMRFNGVPVTWDNPSGNGPMAFVTGSNNLNYFKWDTTFNDYNNAAVQAVTPFYEWIDKFMVCTGTWCGTQ
jgi:hypothetical protein